VGFDASGRILVVSDRFVGPSGAGQDSFEVFRPSRAGVLRAMPQLISVPQEPYAFAFTSRNEMLVANANNNAPLASTTSSYRLDPSGRFTRVAAQPTSQTAGCWIAITDDDRFAFVANGGAPTVVPYAISPGGGFRNLSPGLIMISGLGGDVALSSGSAFLYVLNPDPSGILAFDRNAHADVDVFRVGKDGRTTRLGTFGRLPFSSSGLVAL
jgi:6-phosphogluconolactonase (cycloisomerase 2 family)